MDPITQQVVLAAAGTSAAADATYVDDVFSTYVYEGNGAGEGTVMQSIDNGIDLAGEGGLVWIKRRSSPARDHSLQDTERGIASSLASNSDAAEVTQTNRVSGFNSDGFDLDGNITVNGSGDDYVSWTFRKAPGFFDVVTYTGDGDINRTVSHSLGSVPGMIIVKETNNSGDWYVWHRELGGAGKALVLNSAAATDINSNLFSTLPTASVFSPGDNTHTNQLNQTYVAYIFAHDDQSFGTDSDEAIVHCGSFTGSGSEFSVDIGFEPQWILFKISDSSTRDWMIFDNIRDQVLRPNLSSDSSTTAYNDLRFEPRGFRLLGVNDHNVSGKTTVFMAIRRPHKPPTAATEVFDIDNGGGVHQTGFPVDMLLGGSTNTSPTNSYVYSRLTAARYLVTSSSNSDAESSSLGFDTNDGLLFSFGLPRYLYFFRRAPSFMDMLIYEGTSAVRTVSHNLGVTPELIIIKKRTSSGDWAVYDAINGVTKGSRLNSSNASSTAAAYWNNTAPTSTQFTVDNNAKVNQTGHNYIAFLFATLPGISKVGSYSGTGSNIDVDCGFSAGARFVLIKRLTFAGDWYVWDTTRGIVSGNDPYTLLNSTAAQVTNQDNIDPINSGFRVVSNLGALNATGSTYLFLAIA
jgi:hypothetical protein